jgi:nucleoside 2-deoxyribosyltransferase
VKLYLAGPDVFLPAPLAIGARKRELCQAYGFEGLFPLDPQMEGGADPAAIFRANCALMRAADGGVFNVTPFRGPSADAGTLFELGFLFALGRPVYGYASRGGTYADRVRTTHGPLVERNGRLWDASGFAVENFGLGENLMIVRAIAEAGGQVTVVEEDGPESLAAFQAFEECLRRLRETFGASGAAHES